MRRALLFPIAALIGAPALLAQSSSTGTVSRPLPPQTSAGQTQPAPSGGTNTAPGTKVGSTPTTPGGTETGAGVQPGGGIQPGTRIQDVPNQNPGVSITNVPNQNPTATGTGSPFTGPGVGFADGGTGGVAISDGGSPGQVGPVGPNPGIWLSDGGTGVGFGGADAGAMGTAGPQ